MPVKAMLCTLAVLMLNPPSLADPQFHGNAQHTGVYDAPTKPPVGKLKWKFHTDGRVVASPVIDGSTIYVGSMDRSFYAIDAKSGQQKWKVPTISGINSTAAVLGSLVYFMDYNGYFYAINKETGKVAWKFKTDGEHRFIGTHLHGSEPASEPMPDPFDCFLSSPAIVGKSLYFGCGDGYVYSLDAISGDLNWKYKTGDVVHASPAVANGIVYIGSWDSYFYAIDAATGKLVWRFKTGEDADIHNQVGIQSSACVADGIVYFGCRDSNFYALDAKTGDKKWAYNNKGSWVVGSPAVRDGKVYFATADSSTFYQLDAKSGEVGFSLKFNGWTLFSSPVISGNRVYIGSSEGKLFAIDLPSKSVDWTFQTEASKANAKKYVKPDGTPNYEAAFLGNFYEDMVIGVNKLYEMGSIQSTAMIAGNVIYVGSADGNLYAIE